MDFEIVEYNSFVADLAPVWDELLVKSGSDHAQMSLTWRRLWWEHFRSRGRAKILAAKVQDRIVAILPLYVRRELEEGLPFRTAMFIGGWLADYNQPLLEGPDPSALDAIFSHLKNDRSLSLIDLVNLDPKTLALCEQAAARANLHFSSFPLGGCRYLNLEPDFKTYFQNLSRNTRRDLTKKENRLQKQGSLEFSAVLEAEAMTPLIEAAISLNQERWRAEGEGASIFENERSQNFFRAMALAMAPEGRSVFFTLKLDNRIVAYHFGHLFQKVFSSWNAGWDPELADFSPGRVLEKMIIEWCHQKGIKKIDFMRGDYRYKESWAKDLDENHRLLIARNPLVVKTAMFMLTKVKPWAKNHLGPLAAPIIRLRRKLWA